MNKCLRLVFAIAASLAALLSCAIFMGTSAPNNCFITVWGYAADADSLYYLVLLESGSVPDDVLQVASGLNLELVIPAADPDDSRADSVGPSYKHLFGFFQTDRTSRSALIIWDPNLSLTSSLHRQGQVFQVNKVGLLDQRGRLKQYCGLSSQQTTQITSLRLFRALLVLHLGWVPPSIDGEDLVENPPLPTEH